MSPTDLFFIVLAAVIFGCALVGFSTASLLKLARKEDADRDYKATFWELFLPLLAGAFILYGMWRAGLFG